MTFQIEKIELMNLKNAGTYDYSAGTWGSLSGTGDYSAGLPAAGVSLHNDGTNNYINLLAPSESLLLMPHTIASVTTGTVKITYSALNPDGSAIDGVTSPREFSLAQSADFVFAPGQRYTLQFTFNDTGVAAGGISTLLCDIAGEPWTSGVVTAAP